MIRLRALARSLVILLTAHLSACGGNGTAPGGGEEPDATVASVTVSPGQVTLEVNETTTLEATVRDQDGNTMSVSVSWASSDTVVAEVNGQGMVTAVGAGESTVTATADGVSGPVDVTVEDNRTAVVRAIDDARDIVDRVIPDPDESLEGRNPLEEVETAAEELLALEGVLAVRVNPVGLTLQAVMVNGTSLLFIHNRFDAASDAPAAGHRNGTAPAGTWRWRWGRTTTATPG